MALPFNINSASLVHRVTVRSVVNAPLWVCAVVAVPCFVLAHLSDGWLSVAFFVAGILPVLTFVGAYAYFAVKNPAYLRSEDYQLKAESLRLLGDRDNPLNADARDIVSVTNPELPPPPEDIDTV